jgi:peptide/nickel transport system substrate-binding protein
MGNWSCDEVSGPENQWLGNNIPRWCENGNPEYQAMIDELAVTVDIDRRGEMVRAMNDMIVLDYAMIPLVTRGDVSAVNNTLLGVRFNVWDSELWNIADWSRSSQ